MPLDHLRHAAIEQLPISTIGQGSYILDNSPSFSHSEPEEEEQAKSSDRISSVALIEEKVEPPPQIPSLLLKSQRIQESPQIIDSHPNEWLRFVKGKKSFIKNAQPELDNYKISVAQDLPIELSSKIDV